MDTILASRLHVIATMRTATEYVLEKDEKTGMTVVRKIGLAPVQRDGLGYEFTVVGARWSSYATRPDVASGQPPLPVD